MSARSHLLRLCLLGAQLVVICVPALAAQDPLLSIPALAGQGVKEVVSLDPAPPARTFPPPTTEQTAPGVGKFVIFTREELGKKGQWDVVAGAWECIPSRPSMPITKRIEFCHSSWNASPLLGCLVRDDSRDRCSRFVRLQVDSGDRDYRANLYDIDYRTWGVRCLWQGTRLSAFGILKGQVLCQQADGWLSLDAATGAIRQEAPFIPLDVDGAYWLVQKSGETSGCWSYDPANERYVAHFSEVKPPDLGHVRALLSPDGRSRAWLLVPWPADWRGGLIQGTLVLQRDGQSLDLAVPVEMQAQMGRGRPVIPIDTELEFTRDGKVEFTAVMGKQSRNERVWSVDIASGQTVETQRPRAVRPEDGLSVFHGVPTPEYLRPYLRNLWHFGRSGLAPAFLMHLGVLRKQPEYPDCVAGVSRDGRHVLYAASKGRLAKVFIYGDLVTKQTLRFARPPGIKPDDSMEFVWVETP